MSPGSTVPPARSRDALQDPLEQQLRPQWELLLSERPQVKKFPFFVCF